MKTTNEFVDIDGQDYIQIRDVDRMDPFFMSIVSDSDHWLFVGSNGPFTAGRVNADHALFPYQTVDRILRHADTSGSLTIIQIKRGDEWVTWKPAQKNLYKHVYGTSIVFEESDAHLRFRWSLTTCEPYGFVRECHLTNLTGAPLEVRYLDGWHQLLTPNVSQQTYSEFSYLVAGYMRHEVLPEGLGIFTLNASISDRAEASESLRAACAWSLGHDQPTILLCDRQVDAFRQGKTVEQEFEVRGEMGAYLVSGTATVGTEISWVSVLDTELDHAAINRLQGELRNPEQLGRSLNQAVADSRDALRRRIAGADGLQDTADRTASVHHFANVLFNCMRGGTFNEGYRFPSTDFADFVQTRNRLVFAKHKAWLESLPDTLTISEIHGLVAPKDDAQLSRIAHEYLPLTFSRRHGDPSRPWNRFDIQLKDAQGNPIYAYQGNWRDIFQNWESLAQSYPLYLEEMITIFLNASTADGYNPYRISRAGIDWEAPNPDHPWAHIGYWGDHQIIYLLRLLESYERYAPGKLSNQLDHRGYAYANVPYEIVGFDALTENPRTSIKFNFELHGRLMDRAKQMGSDGKLVATEKGEVVLVSLAEKLLVPVLVKLSNLVPEGGIWLNTQRPEWNDGNNALAGWGLSMVTVYYIRRYLSFLDKLFADGKIEVSSPVAKLLHDLTDILVEADKTAIDDATRYELMAKLGRAGAEHRATVYQNGVSGSDKVDVRPFIAAALPVIDACIIKSRRPDGMFESYNVLQLDGDRAQVKNLSLMLEGQVAALSSGVLTTEEVVKLLAALRSSDLYREDQHSYILYPDRKLTPFLDRNTFDGPPPMVDPTLFIKGEAGKWHFQADLRNTADVAARLDQLNADAVTRKAVLDLWEEIFHHSEFTGRSSTMFMFEGLGSIYWHMVAKLLLAVQECYQQYPDPRIAAAYDEIRDGLGFRKTPEEYGAFPTDPYSHTPAHRGAQQPGMTGQVKEEILTRWGELGVSIEDGCLRFAPALLSDSEFHEAPHTFAYVDVAGQEQVWELPARSLGFTFCQVPIGYVQGSDPRFEVEHSDGSISNDLSKTDTNAILARSGDIHRVTVYLAG